MGIEIEAGTEKVQGRRSSLKRIKNVLLITFGYSFWIPLLVSIALNLFFMIGISKDSVGPFFGCDYCGNSTIGNLAEAMFFIGFIFTVLIVVVYVIWLFLALWHTVWLFCKYADSDDEDRLCILRCLACWGLHYYPLSLILIVYYFLGALIGSLFWSLQIGEFKWYFSTTMIGTGFIATIVMILGVIGAILTVIGALVRIIYKVNVKHEEIFD